MTDETNNSDALNAPIVFNINDAAIAEAKENFKDVDAYKDIVAAKAAKKVLTGMRKSLDAGHKAAKAKALDYGKRCDAEKRRLLADIKEVEDPITEQLDEIRTRAAREEEERQQAITENIDRLRAYGDDRYDLDLDELNEQLRRLRAENLTEDTYQEHLETAEMVRKEVDLKLRLQIDKVEEQQKQEAAQEEIRKENERKQKELDERQAQMDAEEEERRKEREAEEEQRRKEEQERIDKENERLAEEQQRIDEENEKIADREKKEQAEKEAEEARVRELAQAPDKEKLNVYAAAVEALMLEQPKMDTDEANTVLQKAVGALKNLANKIRVATKEMK